MVRHIDMLVGKTPTVNLCTFLDLVLYAWLGVGIITDSGMFEDDIYNVRLAIMIMDFGGFC